MQIASEGASGRLAEAARVGARCVRPTHLAFDVELISALLHLNLYANLNSRFLFSWSPDFLHFGTFSVSEAEKPLMKMFSTFYCCLKS